MQYLHKIFSRYLHYFWNQLTKKNSRKRIVYSSIVSVILLVSSFSLYTLSPYRSTPGLNQYFRARVVTVHDGSSTTIGATQNVTVRLLDGPNKNNLVSVQRVNIFGDSAYKRLPIGSTVLLVKDLHTSDSYSLLARWYMPGIASLFITLIILVVIIGAWRGITSMLGLAISVAILAIYVVPQILAGHNAFTTCIIAAMAITIISIFVAHGISKRTTIAFIASLVVLGLIVGLTAFASYLSGTSEIISEENIGIFYAAHPIDLAGLVTGGVVIASLGALFDITTGQSATVDEIHKTNKKLTTQQLFMKGLSVGREHIAALINTLALVYAGVALPAIVTSALYAQNASYAHTPLLVRLNTETIAEELLRTGVASISVLLALPITTWLAAYILPRWTEKVDTQIKRHLQKIWT